MFWRMTLSTLVAYPVTFFMVRLLGKKQISTLTFWDLVSAIALGSLAANIVVNPEEPLYASAWVVVLWGILALGTGWLALNVPTRYKGLSAALVMEGRVLSANLQRVGLDSTWLQKQLAAEDVTSLDEVFYAELGTDGSLRIDRYDDPRTPQWHQH